MAKATRLLIKNGTLIDGSGGDPVPNRLLVVDGNRITLVGETGSSMRPETPDDSVIDATGKFILPGLIDAHCHISLHQGALPSMKYTSTAEFCTLWAAHAIGRVLRAGVTSIAVPGGKWFTDVTVREAVEGGLLEGPRMVVAGRALGNYGGIFDPDPYPAFEGTPADTAGVLCNTRDEFIRETRKQCKRGVNLIKIADSTWGDVQTVADHEIAAVVDEAHRHNDFKPDTNTTVGKPIPRPSRYILRPPPMSISPANSPLIAAWVVAGFSAQPIGTRSKRNASAEGDQATNREVVRSAAAAG